MKRSHYICNRMGYPSIISEVRAELQAFISHIRIIGFLPMNVRLILFVFLLLGIAGCTNNAVPVNRVPKTIEPTNP